MNKSNSDIEKQALKISVRQIRWEAPKGVVLKIVAFVLLLLPTSFFVFEPKSIPHHQIILSALVAWVGLLPGVAYLWKQDFRKIPFLPLIGCFYSVNFGFVMLAADQEDTSNLRFRIEDVTVKSLILVLVGLALLLGAFTLVNRMYSSKIRGFRLDGSFASARSRTFIWLFLGMHLCYRFLPGISKIPSMGQFLEPIGFLTLGALLILVWQQKLTLMERCLLYFVILPAAFLMRLGGGLLSQSMLLGLFIGVLALRFKPKIVPIAGFLLVGIVVLLSPIKNQFRALTWQDDLFNDLNGVQKGELFLRLGYYYYLGEGNGNLPGREDLEGIANRFSAISLFSFVVDHTPGEVPYWGGETYNTLIFKLIPRILWPDKPTEETGQKFGHRYGLLDYNDTSTSLNLPWIVEMYANFGVLGVLVGMSIAGVLLGSLNIYFNHSETNPVEYLLAATLLFPLVYQESAFSMMVGNLILLFVVFVFILKQILLQRRSS